MNRFSQFSFFAGVSFLSICLPVNGQDAEFQENGYTWNWTPELWTATQHGYGTEKYAKRPEGDLSEHLSFDWQPAEFDRLGNICTIRCEISFIDPISKEKRPVDWLQGVTLFLANSPGTTPDWSKGMDQADTTHDTGVISRSKPSSFEIDVREINHSRNAAEKFQVGIALAKHGSQGNNKETIFWRSDQKAVPASIHMLTLLAAPPLPFEVQLINEARNWPDRNSDAVPLIRAVNMLQRRGKEQALDLLEEYGKNLHQFGDQEIIFWIIRLLFEPIELDERIPVPAIAVFSPAERSQKDNWPLDVLAVVDDVPFMIGEMGGMGGMPESPRSHIEWARQYCVIRDEPLTPVGNPLVAAEKLLHSDRFQQLPVNNWTSTDDSIRSQAISMLHGKVADIEVCCGADADQAKEWQSRLEESKKLGIHWDAEQQRFVTNLDQAGDKH